MHATSEIRRGEQRIFNPLIKFPTADVDINCPIQGVKEVQSLYLPGAQVTGKDTSHQIHVTSVHETISNFPQLTQRRSIFEKVIQRQTSSRRRWTDATSSTWNLKLPRFGEPSSFTVRNDNHSLEGIEHAQTPIIQNKARKPHFTQLEDQRTFVGGYECANRYR
eukprot:1526952-Pyramimonas_sp.AAC.1